MSSEDDITDPMVGVARPSWTAYSRGFVRGSKTYVPGEERVEAARMTGRRLATCPGCRSTWNVPEDRLGVTHPKYNRMREICVHAGSWIWVTTVEVEG